MLAIYFDNCALNRPLDDPRQPRIAAEADAVRRLLLHVRWGRLQWHSAPILRLEVDACSDAERRGVLLRLIDELSTRRVVSLTAEDSVYKRLREAGLHTADAVHLASANQLGAKIFVTCDDRLLRKRDRIQTLVDCRVLSPLELLAEMQS